MKERQRETGKRVAVEVQASDVPAQSRQSRNGQLIVGEIDVQAKARLGNSWQLRHFPVGGGNIGGRGELYLDLSEFRFLWLFGACLEMQRNWRAGSSSR
jgi:hypothetical protein